MPQSWSCLNSATGSDCVVTAFATTSVASSSCGVSSTSPCFNEITYQDWLGVNLWILFSVSFIPLTFFFKRFSIKKGYMVK